MSNRTFDRWIDTFVSEKGLDTDFVFVTLSANGTPNHIPLASVIAQIKLSNKAEQAAIKTVLVKIDFRNGDPMHFFKHLTGAMAVDL